MKKIPAENIVGKAENAPFPLLFSPLLKKNSIIWIKFKLKSANAFRLLKCTFLSSGKEIIDFNPLETVAMFTSMY